MTRTTSKRWGLYGRTTLKHAPYWGFGEGLTLSQRPSLK